MTDGATAPRMRRPSWRDPRLGVGVLLVAASVLLGSWAVGRADDTVEVYRAADTLSPGDALDPDALDVVRVQVPDGVYVTPGEDLPEDAVVVRTVGAGELVPQGAVGSVSDVTVRPVTIGLDAASQAGLEKGSRVDLWVAAPDEDGDLAPPEPLVSDVEVFAVHEDTSLFAGSDEVLLQVLVDVDDLPDVLAAISGEGRITVVPLPGGGP